MGLNNIIGMSNKIKAKITYEPHKPISKIDRLVSMLARYDHMDLDDSLKNEFIELLVQELKQFHNEQNTRFQEQLKNGGDYNY